MSWDLRISLETGDLIFAPNMDLAGVIDLDVVQQRIHTRLKTDRGSFIYDTVGTLGSRLRHLGTRLNSTNFEQGIEFYIREALEPMGDIAIQTIHFDNSDSKHILVTIAYRQNVDLIETINEPFTGVTTIVVISDET